jgi:ribosomal protein L11 methyltransferase
VPRSTWPAFVLRFDPAAPLNRELLSVVLNELGATAIEGDVFDDQTIRVHFARSGARDRAVDHIRGLVVDAATVEAIDLPDEGWAERSQASLKSVRVGAIVIQPPWDPPATDAIRILVEPSMGFGTGHHQSTRVCLLALQRLNLLGSRVVDVGTGSGVLAIAALKLGASFGIALDVDDDALDSARRNIVANGLEGPIELVSGDIRKWSMAQADVVIANLTGPLLAQAAGMLCRATRPSGHIVVGGLTLEEEPAVTGAFQPFADLVSQDLEGDWTGLTFRRR